MKQKLIFLTVLLTAHSAFAVRYFVDASRPDDTGSATSEILSNVVDEDLRSVSA
jgi:hypothetical protein